MYLCSLTEVLDSPNQLCWEDLVTKEKKNIHYTLQWNIVKSATPYVRKRKHYQLCCQKTLKFYYTALEFWINETRKSSTATSSSKFSILNLKIDILQSPIKIYRYTHTFTCSHIHGRTYYIERVQRKTQKYHT